MATGGQALRHTRALDHHFKVKNLTERAEKWNFHHTDRRERQIHFVGGSKVLQRMRQAPTRLPAELYDVAALTE
jgi:hypothetical protein